MSTITARHIFERVRGIINRLPVSIVPNVGGVVEDEDVSTMYNPVDSGSGTISDEVLLYHLNYVQRYIVTSCKVFHVVNNSEEADLSTGPTLVDDQVKGRVVHGSVRRVNASSQEIRARYRDLGEHYDLESSGRNASVEYPAYTYLDHDVSVYPTPTHGSVARYVVSPSSISKENMAAFTDVLSIDSRFEACVVSYVAAKAFQQLEEHAAHSVWMSLFYRKLEPFLIGTRIGDPSTHLVSGIAYERENEME